MSSAKRVLSAFIDPELKAAFHAFAQSQTLTKSKLLSVIVADFLSYAPVKPEISPAPDDIKSSGVYVRLTPHKYAELHRLATARNWHRSTYLAHLFDVHLSHNPHLDDQEMQTLRQLTEQLADLGRNLNQIAHTLHTSLDHAHLALAVDVELIKMLIDAERTAVKNVIRNNLNAWGVSDEQK